MVRKELLLLERKCSVTAFDLKVILVKDGREKGIWIMLDDSGISNVPGMTKGRINVAALMEWKDIKQIHKILGTEITKSEMAAKSQNRKRGVGRRKRIKEIS
jgi:hypothetical protein